MKAWFSSDYIRNLNALSQGGVFCLAAIVSVAPGDVRYLADVQDPFTFNGHLYSPRPMSFEGWGQTSQQSLPTLKVTVADVDGAVDAFLQTTSIIGHDVTLQILHLDLLGTATDQDSIRLNVMLVEWTWMAAVFTLGLNLGLAESIPRHVMGKAQYPGMADQFRRASIL